MKTIKKINILLVLTFFGIISSCSDYLDVVPDNVATIDNAFVDKTQAEKYLFTCYSYLPRFDDPEGNPEFYAGDEYWIFWPIPDGYAASLDPYQIARGLQNRVSPLMNFWEGGGRVPPLWQGIRSCNIFLENIEKVTDLEPFLKSRWISEVKFLKAYYHWYLMKLYGPIPIVDENLPISANSNEVRVERKPVDEVVDYIVSLIDSVTEEGENGGLPNRIDNKTTELGRITKPIALSIKARILVTAASPLFNGNTDYDNFLANDGTPLFNTNFEIEKWNKALKACEKAVEACEAAGITLYEFDENAQGVTDRIQTEMSIRNAVCDKWNSELIWGNVGSDVPSWAVQLTASPNLDPNITSLNLKAHFAPTLRIAELFYTENGVPIDEDKTWSYQDRYNLRTVEASDEGMQEGYKTVGLHFNREPRFYANLGFDGATWFMRNNTWDLKTKTGQHAGKKQSVLYSITGYYAKKLVNWDMVISQGGGVSLEFYPWPVMRLADLYLLYAEALNETDNNALALNYINKVRERAGLETVETSWSNYSTNPGKYGNKDGLREIIQQERLIELALEGKRFWDLKRWKKSGTILNAPIYGWDIGQEDYETYNRKTLLFDQKFNVPRDYFWPLSDNVLTTNPSLIQNPGW